MKPSQPSRDATEAYFGNPVRTRTNSFRILEEVEPDHGTEPTVVYVERKGPAEIKPLLLTVPQAARALGISRTTMYELLNSGDVRYVHLGTCRRIPTQCVEEYVDRLLADRNH